MSTLRIDTLFIVLLGFASVCTLYGCGIKNRSERESNRRSVPEWHDHVERLDGLLRENSGLIHWNGRLWTVNDSGGDPVLYAFDIRSGKVLQEIYIENGSNRDWESLAQDERNIYVCDIGDNRRHRDELNIYKIAKDSIPPSGNMSVSAGIINYSYAGRPFDCEAAFVMGDSLYLLTKDWETRSTTLYTCSTKPGNYKLQPRRTYPVDGLVTGADLSPDGSFLLLCGYKDYVPSIWLFQDFNPADYSHGASLRFDFPDRMNLQIEGIAIESPERVYISSEETKLPAALFRLDLQPFIN